MQGLGRIATEALRRRAAPALQQRVGSVITDLAHRAPMRLLPMKTDHSERVGAAWCVVSGYGGGLVGGDKIDFDVTVKEDTTLWLSTQASTKVYRAKADKKPAVQNMNATIGSGAMLVLTPDPLTPFRDSSYSQTQNFRMSSMRDSRDKAPPQLSSSVVMVDPVSSGRAAMGERWDFMSYRSVSEFSINTSSACGNNDAGSFPIPSASLVDAISLEPHTRGNVNWGMDLADVSRDAFATIVAMGPKAVQVAERLHVVAAALASRNGVRVASLSSQNRKAFEMGPSVLNDPEMLQLAGQAWMGVSTCSCIDEAGIDLLQVNGGEATVARVAVESTDDLYRILNLCLEPLESAIGVVPYADRIHGTTPSGVISLEHLKKQREIANSTVGQEPDDSAGAVLFDGIEMKDSEQFQLSKRQRWVLMQLADSNLPTGGFAHSGGLEAAHQFNLVKENTEDLYDYLYMSVATQLTQHVPFTSATYRLFQSQQQHQQHQDFCHVGLSTLIEQWVAIDKELDALLRSCEASRRASVAQGNGLLRVAEHWFAVSDDEGTNMQEDGLATFSTDSAFWYINARRDKARAMPNANTGPCPLHVASSMGFVGAMLSLPEAAIVDALVYGMSRDLLAAAVRLNLVGPLHAVTLQDIIARDARKCANMILKADTASQADVLNAASASPVIDLAQSGHDLLEMRLFQT